MADGPRAANKPLRCIFSSNRLTVERSKGLRWLLTNSILPIRPNGHWKQTGYARFECILKCMCIFLRHSFTLLIAGSLCGVGFVAAPRLEAQARVADSKPQPDVLILIDDEKVVGHFVGSSGASLRFKSDLLGELTRTGAR